MLCGWSGGGGGMGRGFSGGSTGTAKGAGLLDGTARVRRGGTLGFTGGGGSARASGRGAAGAAKPPSNGPAVGAALALDGFGVEKKRKGGPHSPSGAPPAITR